LDSAGLELGAQNKPEPSDWKKYYRERHLAMAELNKDADAQIAQSEKDYDQAQELLRGFQASGEIDSLSQAAQLMVGVLGTYIFCVFCSGLSLVEHGSALEEGS
jgi:hypothetical protein